MKGQRCARLVGLTALLACSLIASASSAARAATTAETQAVNWAVGQIGSTSYGNLCLTFVYDAYQNGAGINLRNDTTGVTYNSNTDPQDVWGHTATGTTGSDNNPPYGALVFFNAKAGYNPEDYSHVAIMGAGGEMISTNDALNENNVHYETLAQEQGSGSYSTYVGWWLPDGTSSVGGNPADGSFVSYQGNVYRIAGGAPIYVSNWSVYGGAQPTEALSAAQWSALNPVPANGTLISSTATGMVYEIAGGAPLYVSSFAAIGGARAVVGVDQWDITNITNPMAHMNAVPANGTLIGAGAGGQFGGDVFVIAGGAPLYVSNWAAIGGPQPVVGIDEWDVENITNPAAHMNAVPANGTFINTSTGHVYRIAGGAPFAVSNWSVFGGEQPYVTMDEWDIDNITNPAAHLKARPVDGTLVQGLPSHGYWSFNGGLRSPATAASGAVSVDDVGLAAFPQATCPAGQTGTTPNCQTPPSTCPAGQTGTPPNCQTAKPPALRSRCVVPNLKHMKLSTAERALRRAHCGVGTVRRPKHVRRHHVLRVTSQSAVTGGRHSANYPVNLRLR